MRQGNSEASGEGGVIMSYDISFRLKAEGIDKHVDLRYTNANITWNLGTMIRKSTGLSWDNEENNGLCAEIIPAIRRGLHELETRPSKYKQYESPNGYGTIESCKNFFRVIIQDWEWLCTCEDDEVTNAATFWIM